MKTIDAEVVSRVEKQRPLRPSRRGWALAIAGLVDLVQLAFLPIFGEGAGSPFEDALDVVTALALVLILGFDWRLAAAFAAELVPGVDLFPSWTAAVLAMPGRAPTEPQPERA